MPENTPAAPSPFTRRRLLGGGAAVAAATAALSLPGKVRRALAEPLPSKQPNLSDIKHVVLLMQENRSFDHYFGTMPGVRGFGDKSVPKSIFYWGRSTSGTRRTRPTATRRPASPSPLRRPQRPDQDVVDHRARGRRPRARVAGAGHFLPAP